MSYQMFLDDERFPVDETMVIVRSVFDAITVMEKRGCPEFISFDHDLGPECQTGMDLAKWLVEFDQYRKGKFIPANFSFRVHSQNPVGKANIEGLMNQYLKIRGTLYNPA